MRRIRRLLVANRGEIARRIFRTCRALGIASVAVHSDPDGGAPFVREADEAVPLGGASPGESYLRIEAILDAARRSRADAVHPGYGFLSESAAFARACAEAGLAFVGPPPDAIAAMGTKTSARAIAREAGVPVLPGADLEGLAGEERAEAARAVGFPLLVKAAAGGGGRGMRRVAQPEDLEEAVASAAREAEVAFGDSRLLLERCLEAPRHVEIQVMADGHGNVVSLFERECSIQRRHQKVIEECPSPAVDEPLRTAMGEAAVTLARAVGYVGAGTVEFLLDATRGFHFLEMNTRLQVEHAVTEAVTGLDLVALQIAVAEGEPLPEAALRPARLGHAIEARLYAEDPERSFAPVAGVLARFEIAPRPGLRLDAGVETGSTVGVHYDGLLAKVIAHAATRARAAGILADALGSARIHGLVTNRDLLAGVLRHPEFIEGRTDTGFLERHDPAAIARAALGEEDEGLHAHAAALAAAAARRAGAPVLGFVPAGWRNNPGAPAEAAFAGRHGRRLVACPWTREGVRARVDGRAVDARVESAAPDAVTLEVAGVRRRFLVHRAGLVHYVDSPLGHSALVEEPRFPPPKEAVESGSLLAPLPGRVTRVAARAGDAVEKGALVAVVEAMKMEHRVTAPRAGRVAEVRVAEGESVAAGAVLARIVEPPGAP